MPVHTLTRAQPQDSPLSETLLAALPALGLAASVAALGLAFRAAGVTDAAEKARVLAASVDAAGVAWAVGLWSAAVLQVGLFAWWRWTLRPAA